GFLGVVLLFAEQVFGANQGGEENDMKLIAMLVMTVGTIGWTVGSLISKYSRDRRLAAADPTKKEEDLNVMVKTAWQMVVAGTTFTLVALFNGEYKAFDIHAVPVEY